MELVPKPTLKPWPASEPHLLAFSDFVEQLRQTVWAIYEDQQGDGVDFLREMQGTAFRFLFSFIGFWILELIFIHDLETIVEYTVFELARAAQYRQGWC